MSWKPRERTKEEKIIGSMQQRLACLGENFECADCGVLNDLRGTYRCFYCKQFICHNCAENHFRKEPNE